MGLFDDINPVNWVRGWKPFQNPFDPLKKSVKSITNIPKDILTGNLGGGGNNNFPNIDTGSTNPEDYLKYINTGIPAVTAPNLTSDLGPAEKALRDLFGIQMAQAPQQVSQAFAPQYAAATNRLRDIGGLGSPGQENRFQQIDVGKAQALQNALNSLGLGQAQAEFGLQGEQREAARNQAILNSQYQQALRNEALQNRINALGMAQQARESAAASQLGRYGIDKSNQFGLKDLASLGLAGVKLFG